MEPYIKHVRKIFRKINISNPLRIRSLEMLAFRKILRTYLMDDLYGYSFSFDGIPLVERKRGDWVITTLKKKQ